MMSKGRIIVASTEWYVSTQALAEVVSKWRGVLNLDKLEIIVIIVESSEHPKDILADHFLVDKEGRCISANVNPQLYIKCISEKRVPTILIKLYPSNWRNGFTKKQFEDSILHELLHIAYPKRLGIVNGEANIENELWIENKKRGLLLDEKRKRRKRQKNLLSFSEK